MKTSIILITILLAINPQHSGLAQSQWSKTVGGIYFDAASSIIQTTDGGYAVAGTTLFDTAGHRNLYIGKLNLSGMLQWSKTVSSNYGEAYSLIQTTDGGYAMAGITSFGSGNSDMYIVKLDAIGMLQWSKTVGSPSYDEALSIIQTTDGGYAVAGITFFGAVRDMYIVKLNLNGTLQWSKTVGGTGDDEAFSIIQTTDGGYAVAGNTNSFGAGNYDIYIVKLDASGTLQWSKTVGGTGEDEAYSIIQTTDGGYAAAGRTNSFGAGNYDMYIIKLDASGMLQWTCTVGGTNYDAAFSIVQTTDGGYTVAGTTYSFGAGYGDMYIVKLNSGGTLQWSKTVGGAGDEAALSIIQTTDGGYAAAGYTSSFGAGNLDMYIVKFDANGNTCGNTSQPPTISGSGGTLGTPNSIVTSPTSTVTTPTPTISTGGTVTNICVIGIQPISNEIPKTFYLFQNYPNPFNPTTVIKFSVGIPSGQVAGSRFVKLRIYDVQGKEITTLVNENLNPGTYEINWDGSNYPSGVYFYKLTIGDPGSKSGTIFSETKKLVLLK